MAHIMNGEPYHSEEYKIPFVWKWDEKAQSYKLIFAYEDKRYEIQAPGIDDSCPQYKQAYHHMASWAVDDFLDGKTAKEGVDANFSVKISGQCSGSFTIK